MFCWEQKKNKKDEVFRQKKIGSWSRRRCRRRWRRWDTWLKEARGGRCPAPAAAAAAVTDDRRRRRRTGRGGQTDRPGAELGGEGESAEEEEHEEHPAVLEVVEVRRVDFPAVDEDPEVRGVEHLHAHVRERAPRHHVELQQPQRRGGGGGAHGVPCPDAERRRRRGVSRRRAPDPP